MSRDILKTLYLRYNNAYGRQNCQGGNIPGGDASHKFSWPLNKLVLRGHVTD